MKMFIILLITLGFAQAHASSIQDYLCGKKFFQKIHTKFSPKARKLRKVDLFDSKFDPKIAKSLFANIPVTSRPDAIESLIKLADDDLVYNKNLSNYLNYLVDEKLITSTDLLKYDQVFNNKTWFYIEKESGKIASQLNLHPEHLSIIDSITLKVSDQTQITDFKSALIHGSLDSEELILLEKSLKNGKLEDLEKLESFLSYLNTVKKKKRMEVLDKAALALGSEVIDDPALKQFNKSVKKLKAYEEKKFKKLVAKYTKENDGKITPELLDRARKEAKNQKSLYERLYFGCRAKDTNRLKFKDRELIDKKRATFTKFAVFSGVPLSIAGYSIANWDEPKDLAWFGEISYELATGMIFNAIGAKFETDMSASFLKKVGQTYVLSSATDPFVDTGFSYLFSNNNKKAQEELEKLKNDPDFPNKMKALEQYIERNRLFDKVKDQLNSIFADAPKDGEVVDISKLTPADLETEEARDFIIDLIAKEMYENEAGNMIVTGHPAMDRYAFYRAYEVLMIPKGILLGMAVFRTLCMTKNPVMGVALSMSMIVANKLILSPINYKVREWAIGI